MVGVKQLLILGLFFAEGTGFICPLLLSLFPFPSLFSSFISSSSSYMCLMCQRGKPASTSENISLVAMVVHVDTVTIATLLPRPGQEVCQRGFRWRQTVSDHTGGYRNRLVLYIADDPEAHLSVFPTEAVAFELKDHHREAAVTFVSRPKVKGHALLCCHKVTHSQG